MSPPSSSIVGMEERTINDDNGNSNMTNDQRSSINNINSYLRCHLCDNAFVEPASLMACMHTFCRGCILAYTENHWKCPVEGCGASVTCKGGSKESVRNNPIISAVISSTRMIEGILATAPDNWWMSRGGMEDDDDGNEDVRNDGSGEGTTMEVVDFRGVDDADDNDDDDDEGNHDASDRHDEIVVHDSGKGSTRNRIIKTKASSSSSSSSFDGRCSFLHPSPVDVDAVAVPSPVSFDASGISPIALRGSQLTRPDETIDDDDGDVDDEGACDGGPTVTTDSRLDRIDIARSRGGDGDGDDASVSRARVGHEEAPSSSTTDVEGQTRIARRAVEGQTRIARRASDKPRRYDRSPSSIVGVGPSMGRDGGPRCSSASNSTAVASRVSLRRQPGILLLDPTWKLSVEHARRLRKWISDGLVHLLGTTRRGDLVIDAIDTDESFDCSGFFDFDAEGVCESFLSMLSSHRTDSAVPPAPASFYAIGVERDMNFTLGTEDIVVPRSFGYYLAVACGLPIVDADFFSSVSYRKEDGQRYPFPYSLERGAGTTHIVRGASNYTWDAPTRARSAALERHSAWQGGTGPHSDLDTLHPGTDLLIGYFVILIGEFDRTNHRGKRTTAGKRRRGTNSEDRMDSEYCTRGNVSILLRLCGATVFDVPIATLKNMKKGLTEGQLAEIESATPLGFEHDGPALKVVLQSRMEDRSTSEPRRLVIVKDVSDAKSLGKLFLSQMSLEDSDITVVSCQWLLDSIGEFKAQEMSRYRKA